MKDWAYRWVSLDGRGARKVQDLEKWKASKLRDWANNYGKTSLYKQGPTKIQAKFSGKNSTSCATTQLDLNGC